MDGALATNGTASFVRDMVNALGLFNASPRDPFLGEAAVFWGRGGELVGFRAVEERG